MKAIPSTARRAVRFLALPLLLAAAPALRAQGDTPLIDTRSTATGSVVEREALENLPSGRNPADLASTLPQTGVPARTSLSGSADALITVDGVVIGDQGALGSPGTYVDYEQVEKIEVQRRDDAAEYGNSAAGVIRVVTKSGTTQWEGTGRYLVGDGDPDGLGSLTNPGIQIEVAQDATGAYCLSGFQVQDGGVPLEGAGSGGPIQFGFDNSITIGVGSGPGTAFGAGADGSLNLSSIPGCPGQPFGMSFVDAPGREVVEPEETGANFQPLFSESFYERAPNYTQLFPHGFWTERSVRSAPGGRGVQDIGLEIRSAESERTLAPAWEDDVPGGATSGDASPEAEPATEPLQALADALDSPLLYVVANGGPTGEVFQVRIVHPASGRMAIDGLVAVEPVAATAEDRQGFERDLARAGGIQETLIAAGYCLNQDLLAPPAGTIYRVAPAAKQSAFAPMRRALDAARRLRDAGQLHPDSDPTDYYHSIRQWAVWSIEKGYDREGFLDAFIERTEKNFRDAGQPWSADVAAAVRSYGEGRWSDIQILDAAETTP